jgi:hypothetical protein
MVSDAGKNIPVLVSPLVVNAGSATVPACNVVTPVALSVVNAPVEGVVAPRVPFITAPVSVLFVSVVVLVAVTTLVGVIIPDSATVAMIKLLQAQ